MLISITEGLENVSCDKWNYPVDPTGAGDGRPEEERDARQRRQLGLYRNRRDDCLVSTTWVKHNTIIVYLPGCTHCRCIVPAHYTHSVIQCRGQSQEPVEERLPHLLLRRRAAALYSGASWIFTKSKNRLFERGLHPHSGFQRLKASRLNMGSNACVYFPPPHRG